MIVNVKARYAHGVLTPLEPLDLDEGKEVMVSIEDTKASVKDAPEAGQGLASLAARVAELRESVPPETWDDLPTDLAKNNKHYLYGHPREEKSERTLRRFGLLDRAVEPKRCAPPAVNGRC